MTHRAQDDFYLHVNSNWLNDPSNAIPGEYPRWGGFIKLHDNCLKNQIKLVQELKSKEDKNDEEKKISAIWMASMSRFDNWTNGKGDYKSISSEFNILDEHLLTSSDTTDYVSSVAKYLNYTLSWTS